MADGIDETDQSLEPTRSIFILGILPRSGTNYLQELICVHPHCGAPSVVREDYLLYHVDLLSRYVDAVFRHWNPVWGADQALRDRLLARLGSGIVAFLAERTTARRLVTKTPRVDHLDQFFKLFPDAQLLILVRDGRAVVESGVRTFGWIRQWAIRRWAEAAEAILAFDRSHQATPPAHLIVRYEDLWLRRDEELRRILEFLGLDAGLYDFHAAATLPIKGSSTVRKSRREAMHWKPMEKSPDFDPMSRYRHWRRARHERFNWIAGNALSSFGYEPNTYPSNQTLWALWNQLLDACYFAMRVFRPVYWVARAVSGRRRRRQAVRRTAAQAQPQP